jgi:phage terminase large subunit-like protein
MKTQDEVDIVNPVKAAPVHLGYLETLTHLWLESNKLIIDKSRRMFVSWWALGIHLHYAFTNTNRRIGIVSKKFEDACSHLTNMEFIWKNIPEEVYPSELRPKMRTKEGFIFFDEIDTTIHAIASGPDQTRQYGYSALFFDEFDFWSEQESTYAAAKPTLGGGGKLTIATTHCPQTSGVESFYKQLLEDQL